MKLLAIGIIALALSAEAPLPPIAVGKWTVGKPYDGGQPVGIDAKQEETLVGLVIKISPTRIAVCGKDIPITSVKVDRLTSDDFLAKYGFTPNRIGFSDAGVLDIDLNTFHSTNACGEFADPGTHLLANKGHAVVVIANDYFHLTK